ncbi:MAG: hypothetical protein GF411_15290 [Candidatus Lokiarchaeota archaeon]|nr:hypothetical protein [Candidatus Lokiarchaeota archaeon]
MKVVTLSGIEEFVSRHNRGETLPKEWDTMVLNYIRQKERFMEMHKKRYERAERELKEAKEGYYLLSGVMLK